MLPVLAVFRQAQAYGRSLTAAAAVRYALQQEKQVSLSQGRPPGPRRGGPHRCPGARPVGVNSRVGSVHPGDQPRVYPATIRSALGSTQVRKVRGPLLDTLYARLMQCGNLPCTGRPFTEHRNVPDLRPDPADPRPKWQQAADKLRAAIRSGELAPADALPSVPKPHELQGLKPRTVRHAFQALGDEGLVRIRHGADDDDRRRTGSMVVLRAEHGRTPRP